VIGATPQRPRRRAIRSAIAAATLLLGLTIALSAIAAETDTSWKSIRIAMRSPDPDEGSAESAAAIGIAI